ncbi:MAG: AAA family ATPase, partial [Thermodesulfobacteriota bacterium]
MLLELRLKNFAIVDSISIIFENGLNIITGETGTGKSIIIDAINIVLGNKFGADSIRSGQTESEIEALFEIPEHFTT